MGANTDELHREIVVAGRVQRWVPGQFRRAGNAAFIAVPAPPTRSRSLVRNGNINSLDRLPQRSCTGWEKGRLRSSEN